MTPKNSNPRCKGQTKSGKPCQAAATAGGLCFFHTNPNKAAELGRIGGRRNRRPSAAESVDALPKLESATAVRDAVSQLVADVYAGRLQPRVAAGLAPLMNLLLRAIATSDLEERIAIVEKRLAAADTVGGKQSEERASLAPESH